MIQRTPNDPGVVSRAGCTTTTWRSTCPGLYFMSWYDVSVGPNLALFNHVRQTVIVEGTQYAMIAPTLHCAYKRATENTVVGERSDGRCAV